MPRTLKRVPRGRLSLRILFLALDLLGKGLLTVGCGGTEILYLPADKNCDAPWGDKVANGATVRAYQASSVPAEESCDTVAVELLCTDGELSIYASAPAESTASGANSGATIDSFRFESCSPVPAEKGCMTPWSQAMKSGESVTACKLGAGNLCSCQDIFCQDGDAAFGVFGLAACPDPLPDATCSLPDGSTVDAGTSSKFYSKEAVPSGESCEFYSSYRTCSTQGTWSGDPSYIYGACSTLPPSTCAFPGGGVAQAGESRTFYRQDSVPFGTTCSSTVRTCSEAGTWSGDSAYAFASCVVQPRTTCTLPSVGSIPEGESRWLYSSSSVPYGSSCSGMERTCLADGTLSGSASYVFPSCVPASAPQPCALPWGGTLADGQQVDAYASSAPPSGGSCQKETRQCVNGVLSGSYSYQACTPPYRTALWDGGSIYATDRWTGGNPGATITVNFSSYGSPYRRTFRFQNNQSAYCRLTAGLSVNNGIGRALEGSVELSRVRQDGNPSSYRRVAPGEFVNITFELSRPSAPLSSYLYASCFPEESGWDPSWTVEVTIPVELYP